MAKSPPKDYYASVMFPGTKKLSIVTKRVGSKERLHAIATCTSEMIADKIVEALNLHQGDSVKLEAPMQRINEDLRAQLQSERAVISGLRTELSTLRNEKHRLVDERDRAIRERDAAQKRVTELTPTTHPALASS
jgi:hypothetical protein